MPCRFRIRPKHNINEVYQIALREIKRFGAKYTGDDTGGKFEVEILKLKFKGSIEVKGNVLIVEISDKPMLIPCSLIEESTKQYVAGLQLEL